MIAVIMVSMHQVEVVAAQILPAVTAELGSGLAATFLVRLQFLGTAKSSNIADLNFLAGFHQNVG